MTPPGPTAAPTTAERIRSACERGTGAQLAVDGIEPIPTPVHHLLADGSFAITVPADRAAALVAAGDAGLPAMLEIADCTPVPMRQPVRSLVWIQGRLRDIPTSAVPDLLDVVASRDPNPALLQVCGGRSRAATDPEQDIRHALMRLEIESVVVADAAGAGSVAPHALMDARPDPFCTMESFWLQHLESAHRDVIERLALKIPPSVRRGQVRPLGLDRYGVQLRVEGDDGDHDIRLPFAKPVDDITGLNKAIRVLLGCPFRNGLRARGA